jgi:hypothetical protein
VPSRLLDLRTLAWLILQTSMRGFNGISSVRSKGLESQTDGRDT